MRLAVISDVHGNLPALEAVLADIAAQGADTIVNLGDCVSGPIDPAGAADRLMGLDAVSIRGNHDRWLVERDDLDSVDRYVRPRLTQAQTSWLAALPPTAVIAGTVFACHGTPQRDDEVWLDAFWEERRTTLPDEPDVELKAAGLDYPVIVCGHTHLARTVRLADDRLIVNPGAVGIQLVHGSPDSRYALIERRGADWLVCLRAVPYDRRRAAAMAAANGFPLWEKALMSGWTDPAGLF